MFLRCLNANFLSLNLLEGNFHYWGNLFMFGKTGLKLFAAPLMAAGMFAFSATANAQDKYQPEPNDGNFMFKVLGTVASFDPTLDARIGGVDVAGEGVDVSSAVVPTVAMTLFLNQNLAIEAICCVSQHTLTGQGSLQANGDIGSTWVVPATVTAQYHFTGLGAVKPYLGVGLAAFLFFDEQVKGPLKTAGYNNLNIDPALGLTLQAGMDIELSKGWYMTFDVKRIFIDVNPSFTGNGLNKIDGTASLNPVLVSAGLAYRFDLF